MAEAVNIEDSGPTLAEKRRGRRWPDGAEERAYNVALARLLHGKPPRGGWVEALAVVSGLSERAIFVRVDRLLTSDPDALDREESGLSGRDGDYFEMRYKHSKDPVIRDFLASLKRREG
jgi:hypothetical protein